MSAAAAIDLYLLLERDYRTRQLLESQTRRAVRDTLPDEVRAILPGFVSTEVNRQMFQLWQNDSFLRTARESAINSVREATQQRIDGIAVEDARNILLPYANEMARRFETMEKQYSARIEKLEQTTAVLGIFNAFTIVGTFGLWLSTTWK